MRSLTANRSAKAAKLLQAIDAATARYDLLPYPTRVLEVVESWGDFEWERVAVSAGKTKPDTSKALVLAALRARVEAFAQLRNCDGPASRMREYAEEQYRSQAHADGFLAGLLAARPAAPRVVIVADDPHLTRSGRAQRFFGDAGGAA